MALASVRPNLSCSNEHRLNGTERLAFGERRRLLSRWVRFQDCVLRRVGDGNYGVCWKLVDDYSVVGPLNPRNCNHYDAEKRRTENSVEGVSSEIFQSTVDSVKL